MRIRLIGGAIALGIGAVCGILFLAFLGFWSLIGPSQADPTSDDFAVQMRWQHGVAVADIAFRPAVLPEKTPVKILSATLDGAACDQPVGKFSPQKVVAVPFHKYSSAAEVTATMEIRYQIEGTDAIGRENVTVYIPGKP